MKNKEKLEDKRNYILDTFEQMLMQMNPSEISIEKLAEAANIGKGSIYYYFDSKEEIVKALLNRKHERICADLQPIKDDPNLNSLERIKCFLNIYARSLALYRHVVKFTYSDENVFYRKALDDRNVRLLSRTFAEMINEGIEEGIFSCEYPQGTAELLSILVEGQLCYIRHGDCDPDKIGHLLAMEKLMEAALHAENETFSFYHKIIIQFASLL